MKNNYKKILLSVFILLSGYFISAQSTNFTITYKKEDFKLKHINEFTQIECESIDYYFKTEVGKPAIPYLPINFVVPYGSEFAGIEFNYDTVLLASDIIINPTQHLIRIGTKKNKHQEVKPLKEIYRSSNPFPKDVVKYTSSQLMSRYQFFTFDVSPLIYYPLQKRLYLIKNLHVTVSFNADPENFGNTRFDDGTFYGILKDEVINPDELESDFRDDISTSNCEYLIITGNSLKDAFQPLADWKNQKGIRTEIITTEHIYSSYQGATDQLKIKSCICDYYQNKGTLFVLLGGDINIVPVQRCYVYLGDPDNTIPTDLYYSCFDGAFDWDANKNKVFGETTDNIDLAPEVFITRTPVNTVSHANAFVDKSLNYEKNPPVNDFANEMLNIGITLGTIWDGRCDAAWKTERVFNDYVDPYWNGIHHSFYQVDSSGTSYDINDSLVKSQIDKGYNFMFMTSHGYPDSWKKDAIGAAYFFNIEDAYELNNADQQGIIVTIACLTNAFDDYILYDISSGYPEEYDSCLSEAFIRNPNGGAVAYHGCSRVGLGLADQTSNLGPSFLYSANFFKCLFSGLPFMNKYKLGAAATQTKIHLIGPSSYDGAYRWLQFALNTLGDTELDILTEDPVALVLNCPDTIPLGNLQNITISTNDPYVNICINNGKDVLITGETDQSGNFICMPSPLITDPLIVTASAHNKIFAVDTIKVGDPDGAVVVIDDYSVNAEGDSIIAYCENVEVSITLKNIGIDTAFNTNIQVFEDDDYIVLNIDSDSLGTIPPGESITKVNAFNFDVICYVPDKYSFDFDAIITDNLSQRSTTLNFIAYSPEIIIKSIDVQCGNFNTFRSNDSADIFIEIHNAGGAQANSIKALLTTEFTPPYLFVYDFIDSTTQLNTGENKILHYGASNNGAIGDMMPFIHEINADDYSTAASFHLQVIDSLENFETGDFTLYPWDLSQGDSEWIIDSVNAYNGNYCARSGVVSRFQRSIIELELKVINSGYISFYKKTSYQSASNDLNFYIDSILQKSWYGGIDWSKEVFPVSEGIHTFTWEYAKTVYTINDTTDCVWIDYIAFPNIRKVGYSVDEIVKPDDYFSIYPNPNNGLFNIVINSEISEDICIEIYNLQGQIIYKKNISSKNKRFSSQINLGSIAKGIYLIKIQSDKFFNTEKIIVK